MAEDFEKQTDFLKFSRNLKKATMRNTAETDSLKKDLKFMQGERMKRMHSWEQKKQAFVKQKFSKRPLVRWNAEEMEKEYLKEKLSEQSTNSRIYSKTDKSVLDRSELSSLKFFDSGHEHKELYTLLGDNKANISSIPKLTVRDLSKILCPDEKFAGAGLSDGKNAQYHLASPSTPSQFHLRFSSYINKDAPLGNGCSSPACSLRTPLQTRHHRTLSLNPSELNQTRDRKITATSPSSDIRKRATTWSPRPTNFTLVSEQNSSLSKKLNQVCCNAVLQF